MLLLLLLLHVYCRCCSLLVAICRIVRFIDNRYQVPCIVHKVYDIASQRNRGSWSQSPSVSSGRPGSRNQDATPRAVLLGGLASVFLTASLASVLSCR